MLRSVQDICTCRCAKATVAAWTARDWVVLGTSNCWGRLVSTPVGGSLSSSRLDTYGNINIRGTVDNTTAHAQKHDVRVTSVLLSHIKILVV